MRSSKIQISNYNQSIQSLNSILAERDQSIQSLNAQLAERDQSIQSLNSLLAERDQSIQMLIFENVMYATSHSWQITRPLRKISQFCKRRKNA